MPLLLSSIGAPFGCRGLAPINAPESIKTDLGSAKTTQNPYKTEFVDQAVLSMLRLLVTFSVSNTQRLSEVNDNKPNHSLNC